jgi:citrate synthase
VYVLKLCRYRIAIAARNIIEFIFMVSWNASPSSGPSRLGSRAPSYTSEKDGTEQLVKEPQATFSSCGAQAFLAPQTMRYVKIREEASEETSEETSEDPIHGGCLGLQQFLVAIPDCWNLVSSPFSRCGVLSLEQHVHDTVSQMFGGSDTENHDGWLSITDERTGKKYRVGIEDNAIKATDFLNITVNRARSRADHVDGGLKLYDPGYQNTAVVKSAITVIDGKRGTIHFRGHPLDDLMKHCEWEEVVYLIIWGHLPKWEERLRFQLELASNMVPPTEVLDAIRALSRDAPMSSMLSVGLAVYSSCDEGSQKLHSSGKEYYLGHLERVDKAIIRTLSAFAVTIAVSYCHKRGIELTPANPNGSFIGNVIRMMGKPSAMIEECLKQLWVLYADHEMTNSTSAFLHASSSLTDPISAVNAGLVCAYGPLHAAALERAYADFERLGTEENVPELIESVARKEQRLFGYGHRIYQAVDPRAKHIHGLIEKHHDLVYCNPLLKVALEVDRLANKHTYFTSRGLKANCDLYGCFLYTAMGFEVDVIVALASLSRTGGVMAHWREQMQSPQELKLWRPRQIYTGL